MMRITLLLLTGVLYSFDGRADATGMPETAATRFADLGTIRRPYSGANFARQGTGGAAES
ncbi:MULTISPECIES: hypothetical protein [unclassified Sphingomonas]|uniref:hypothetical protein n=1 Tax=unclassified Sphingomonas TaxID=196159 RepID=UPI00138EF39E|nr:MULTISPECIES: hypothetical protein [unclassified Sphingomonas]